ncbi:hypothetical protein GN956_G8946 [Arapaima gigas]
MVDPGYTSSLGALHFPVPVVPPAKGGFPYKTSIPSQKCPPPALKAVTESRRDSDATHNVKKLKEETCCDARFSGRWTSTKTVWICSPRKHQLTLHSSALVCKLKLQQVQQRDPAQWLPPTPPKRML